MRALVKTDSSYGNMSIQEVNRPEAADDDVIIKVAYAGICGTDLHCYKGQYDRLVTPIILGHEFSGVVAEVGTNVKNIKVGDRVTSETTYKTCGECRFCLNKEYNLCSNRRGIGTQIDGGFAQYVRTREESVHKLTDNISLLDAALSEPFACGVHASMEKVEVSEDDVAVIVGPGPIGLTLAQVLLAKKATVILIGITNDVKKMEMALEMGVDYIIDSQTEEAKERVLEITNGIGAEYCFECSGSKYALRGALDYLQQKGTLVQMGVFSEAFNELDMNSIVQRELNVIGSRSQKPSSWIKTLELMDKGFIEPEKLVTNVFTLDEWEEAFSLAGTSDEIKILIKPNNDMEGK